MHQTQYANVSHTGYQLTTTTSLQFLCDTNQPYHCQRGKDIKFRKMKQIQMQCKYE